MGGRVSLSHTPLGRDLVGMRYRIRGSIYLIYESKTRGFAISRRYLDTPVKPTTDTLALEIREPITVRIKELSGLSTDPVVDVRIETDVWLASVGQILEHNQRANDGTWIQRESLGQIQSQALPERTASYLRISGLTARLYNNFGIRFPRSPTGHAVIDYLHLEPLGAPV